MTQEEPSKLNLCYGGTSLVPLGERDLPFHLSIVIPAYREEKRIGETLDELAVTLEKEHVFQGKRIEILVVAADSPDKTHDLVLAYRSKINNLSLLRPGPRVGKGRDVRYGMLHANGKAIIYMDADMATPMHHLAEFYKMNLDGAQVVVATRDLKKHHPAIPRRLLSRTGNALFRMVGGPPIEDSQCGFKLFSYAASRVCFGKLSIQGWGFDMEALTIARVNKFEIVCRRVDDWSSRPDGSFDDCYLRNALTALRDLGHILLRRLSGSYSDRATSRSQLLASIEAAGRARNAA
jgi:dolichyl-phosphate beta-glucosyltransferase